MLSKKAWIQENYPHLELGSQERINLGLSSGDEQEVEGFLSEVYLDYVTQQTPTQVISKYWLWAKKVAWPAVTTAAIAVTAFITSLTGSCRNEPTPAPNPPAIRQPVDSEPVPDHSVLREKLEESLGGPIREPI